jgi:hypothetical protein
MEMLVEKIMQSIHEEIQPIDNAGRGAVRIEMFPPASPNCHFVAFSED